MVDVAIVGASPAGLTAGLVVAAAGHEVLVLDEHSNGAYPAHCTGLVGLEMFDEFDLPRNTILNVARSVLFRVKGAEPVFVESDRIKAAIIDRVALDTALALRAVDAGVSLRRGVIVRRIETQPGQVLIHADGYAEPLAARACVLACDAGYRFHRALGLGVPHRFVQTAQIEAPFPFNPHVEVQFGNDVAPAGFAWRLPFSRDGVAFARLGLICTDSAVQRCRRYVADSGRERGIDPAALPLPRPKLLPLVPVAGTYADRVLAVGDAAGLVKPATGAGIQYGLLTGRWAGLVLSEALRHDTLSRDHLQSYEDEWSRQLGPEIRAGLALRAIAARLDDHAIATILNLVRGGGIVPLLKATADLRQIVFDSLVA